MSNQIRQKTTPTHTFTLPEDFDPSIISVLEISYRQNQRVVLIKGLSDVTIDGRVIRLNLTQAETLSFDSKSPVSVQVAILTNSNNALLSDKYPICVYEAQSKNLLGATNDS